MTKLETPNSMEIAGRPAAIIYMPELNVFRGEFLSLSGYCDFVSSNIQGPQKERELSLRGYFEDCEVTGIESYARAEKIKTFTLCYPRLLSEHPSNAATQQ